MTFKTDSIIVGTNTDDTRNFLLDTDLAGALRIRRKSDGSGGAVLTIDSAGRVTLPVNNPGNAPVFGARAWCVFDGTLAGTNAPIAGGNVTSVTRNSAGDYTINFTTAMSDANYGITGTARAAATNGITVVPKQGGTLTVNAAQIITDRNTSGVLDSNLVTVAIFR